MSELHRIADLKTLAEIELMREAGRVVAGAHRLVKSLVAPGISTTEIDQAIENFLLSKQSQPLFKGVPGVVPFPAVSCISVNDEVVHGIPSERKLCAGDVVSVDIGAKLNGWCGDSAWTYAVGKISPEHELLMEVGEGVLMLALELMKNHRRWSEVATNMQEYVFSHDLAIVLDFVGHGIGQDMHEEPEVPNFWVDDMEGDFIIEPGIVLAIEPMVAIGSGEIYITEDHWTVKTLDQGFAVHFEHTIAMTKDGPTLLTI